MGGRFGKLAISGEQSQGTCGTYFLCFWFGVGLGQVSDTAKETVVIFADYALKTAFLGLKICL
jgi:hypothetical protein